MNRMEFVEALRHRLTDEGFNAEYVDTQCSNLTEKLSQLTDDSAAQYTTDRNLDIIVRKLMIQDGSQRKVKPLQPKTPPEDVEKEDVADDLSPDEPAIDESLSATTAVHTDVEFVDDNVVSTPRRRAAESASEYVPCDTILLILGAAFGLFGGVFMLLAVSILFIVIAIIAIVGVGSVLSVAALLYGATQVLSSPRYVGFHEIGFGLLVAGITMAAYILLYNAAIRLIPFLYLQMGKLLKLFSRKLVAFAKNAVKGCEQL